MSETCINLARCLVFADSPDWINLDFTAASAAVRQANLLDRLPLHSDTARLVYSSHFLEHIPRPDVDAFLRECPCVLNPGGYLRLALPDLQEMAASYPRHRDAGEYARADFLVLEMIDQCVRRESGGELGRLYRELQAGAHAHNAAMLAFIRVRTGEDLAPALSVHGRTLRGDGVSTASHLAFATGSSASGCKLGCWRFLRPSARRTSAWQVSASAIIGSGISTNWNKHSKRLALPPSNAARPTLAHLRISPSGRSTSPPMVRRARVSSRCTWRPESPNKHRCRCARVGSVQ